MTPQRHAQVKDIFLKAVQVSKEQRADWLQRECPDAALRVDVEALLAGHTDATIVRSKASTGDLPGAVIATAKLEAIVDALITAERPEKPTTQEPEDRPAGTVIAERYRIVAKLGRGGMGVVYRADDTVLDQPVAIKFLPPEIASSPSAIARFRNEARLARTVTHPNVCRIHDINEANGENFITMEFVAGEDLASLLRRIGRLPTEKAIEVARQTCAGLAAAHAAGVLHRDLKPANILIDANGNVRLSDFGLAAISRELSTRERLAGTPAYMAPEQIRGAELSPRTDLYALGLVIYELFSGRPAFHGDSIAEYLELQLNSEPEPLSERVPDVPDAVDAVVAECLQKDPENRPRSALHVAAALPGTDIQWLAAEANQTPDPELLAAAAAPAGARGGLWFVLALALLAAVVLTRMVSPSPWDAPSELAPAVLVDRAKQVLDASGVGSQPYQAWGFCTPATAWRAIVRSFVSDVAVMQFVPAEPSAPSFFYRQGPRPVTATLVENFVWNSGLPGPADPPADSAGSRFVLLDQQGRLLVLWAASPVDDPPPGKVDGQERWLPLWKAAGFAKSPEGPSANVPTRGPFADCTLWNAGDNGGQTAGAPMVVGCAAAGHPTLFAVGAQASADTPPVLAGDTVRRTTIVTLAFRAMFVAAVLIAIPLVYSAGRSGKLDVRGAARIAAFVAIACFAAAVLRMGGSTSVFEAVCTLSAHMILAMGLAAVLGLLYLAIDSRARRHWPHLLVTWNHLSVRGLRDPAVPRHVLIGVCLGAWWAFVLAAERAFVNLVGWPARPPILEEKFAEKLIGPGSAVASVLSAFPQAMLGGLIILVMLAALRAILRNSLAAAVVSVLILAPVVVPRGANLYTALPAIGVGFCVVCVWAAVQFGMLSVVVGLFVAMILNTTPLTIDPSSWLFPGASVVLAAIALLIGYGALSQRLSNAQLPRGRVPA